LITDKSEYKRNDDWDIKFPQKIPYSTIIIDYFLLLAGIGEAAKLKIRVIVERANVRLKPDINSSVIARAPIGIVLES